MARPIDGNSYVGGEDNYSDGENIQIPEGVGSRSPGGQREVATNQDFELSGAGLGGGLNDAGKAYVKFALEQRELWEAEYAASLDNSRLYRDRCPDCGRPYDREEDFSNVGRVTK